MSAVYEILVAVHVVAALNAVPSFWIALLLEKGSPAHRSVGRLCVRSLAMLALSGGLLAAALAWDPLTFAPPAAGADVAAYAATLRRIASVLVFVAAFLLWLVGFACRALRRPRDGRIPRRDAAIAALLAGAGAAALPFASHPGWETLDGGGLLLLACAALHLARARRGSPRCRRLDHVAGILTAGTLLHAALAIQLASRLLPGFQGERMFDAGLPVLLAGAGLTLLACRQQRRAAPARERGPLARRGVGTSGAGPAAVC